MPLVKVIIEETGLDFTQAQFKYMIHQMIIQQGTIEKNRCVEDGIILLESHIAPMLEYLLGSKFGQNWMAQQDEAYGDTLLHIAVELYNVSFTKIVLANNKAGTERDLHKVRNLNGITPEELLAKEIKKADGVINQDKRERILVKLLQIKDLFPESDIYSMEEKKEEVAEQIEKKTVTSVFKQMINKQPLPSSNLFNTQQRFDQLIEKYPEQLKEQMQAIDQQQIDAIYTIFNNDFMDSVPDLGQIIFIKFDKAELVKAFDGMGHETRLKFCHYFINLNLCI